MPKLLCREIHILLYEVKRGIKEILEESGAEMPIVGNLKLLSEWLSYQI